MKSTIQLGEKPLSGTRGWRARSGRHSLSEKSGIGQAVHRTEVRFLTFVELWWMDQGNFLPLVN